MLYAQDGWIARITLERPDILNAIDERMPGDRAAAVERAKQDRVVHVIMLSGAGKAFRAGGDPLRHSERKDRPGTQKIPWDPMKDHTMRYTECFMSLWRSYKPIICKVHGYAVAGGSHIVLCADIVITADDN